MLKGALEHSVVVLASLRGRNLFHEAPMLDELFAIDPVEIDVDTRVRRHRPLGGDNDKVSFPKDKLHLVYRSGWLSRLVECAQVPQERCKAVADTGFVTDMIFRDIVRDLAVVAANVNRLV